ncbi:aspartate 1-decarboxylase [bacterium]|jgi:aspartate 1-decarboxylase|nr:aspartate 1-decarboxylase [bacterium]
MLRMMCKSKIHRVTVTDKSLNYEGSITIDEELAEAANLAPYEVVKVANLNNGERFQTYVINGKRGSGEIILNGAAARLGEKGDKLIIMAFCMVSEEKVRDFHPSFVAVDSENRIVKKK